MTSSTDENRLPTTVIPRRYEILLIPDLDSGLFSGSVAIELEVLESTDSITLHALDLDITDTWARFDDAEALDAELRFEPEREWVTVLLPEELQVGTAELHMDFAGTLGDRLVGFYRSSFDVDGETHDVAVTQFESTHARLAFPCFDEPAFKARFAITLVVPSGVTAVSNAAELARTEQQDGTDRVTFAETIPMSTYLVAFVIGALEVTEAVNVAGRDGGIAMRVLHPPGSAELCGFALEVAEAGIHFFEDYYDIAYPGDKIDLVAVPDFAFGAMENLGCITFREVLLLVDPNTATPKELQRVADVINHELAHMWFGDLVTMRWWNGIWLNEAFATFMELTATDAFRPEWDVWTNFGLARTAAFDTDSLRSTRPIEFEVSTATDAEAMFDVLTYEKGCSVVRMLEQYLGPEAFRDGIRAYLRANAFDNTETTDLWDALEASSGEPVRRIMDAWIFNGGHPMVTVSSDVNTLMISQRRALLDPDRPTSSDVTLPVPMVLEVGMSGGVIKSQRVLLENDAVVLLDSPAMWVQTNVSGNGFYRTLLPEDLRLGLAQRGGTALERFVLLDDTWFAVLSGLLDAADARATLEAIATHEGDPVVWRRISSICSEHLRLSDETARGEFSHWVRDLVGPAAALYPIDDPGPGRAAEVAGTILALAGTSGADTDAITAARAIFAHPVHKPAIDAAALEVVARHADPEEHRIIRERWHTASTPQDEQRHLAALALTHDPKLFTESLHIATDEVRIQDAPFLLGRALANSELGDLAWEFVSSDWDDLTRRFAESSLPRMLEGIRGFTSDALAEEVTAFLDEHPLHSGSRQVEQHIERMWATVAAARRFRAPDAR